MLIFGQAGAVGIQVRSAIILRREIQLDSLMAILM